MRVFERLASVVRGDGDEVRLSIKRQDNGHVILLTPVLRGIDADEKDDVIRTLHGLLSVPTRIEVPSGQDADAAVEQYLDGTAHAERASAVVTLGEYTDAIREASNAAKTATRAKAPSPAKAKESSNGSKPGKGATVPAESKTPIADTDATPSTNDAPAAAAAAVSASTSDMSVASLFGEAE